MSNFQFYPTPDWLSDFAVSLFKQNRIGAMLEPSAGQGALIRAANRRYSRMLRDSDIFAIEIDPSNQEHLKSMHVKIVGHNFLEYTNGRIFSHILMNPPFAQGVDHVLHAWNILGGGEVVAIVNAETVLNPCDSKRALLVKLIKDHGHVTIIDDAFSQKHGAMRPANVDVAVIYLKKDFEELQFDFTGTVDDKSFELESKNKATDIGFPVGRIQSYVNTFNAAVKAFEAAIHAQNTANTLKRLLGETQLEELAKNQDEGEEELVVKSAFSENMHEKYREGYLELKRAAWWSIVRYAKLDENLTEENKQRFYKELENIYDLEFSASNIFGFLSGFSCAKQELNNKMLTDVFDLISRYHPENRVFYKGWKSNGHHRMDAFKIKMRRFILPIRFSWSGRDLTHDSINKLVDLDKAFTYLDGKVYDEDENAINGFAAALKSKERPAIGERHELEYFDYRLYAGGTIHLFPKRKDLVERLNYIVGKLRNWLPQDKNEASAGFWEQYEASETINSKMKKATVESINEALNSLDNKYWLTDEKKLEEEAKLATAYEEYLSLAEKMGIDTTAISHAESVATSKQLTLLAS